MSNSVAWFEIVGRDHGALGVSGDPEGQVVGLSGGATR
jgi:hypothetical protein